MTPRKQAEQARLAVRAMARLPPGARLAAVGRMANALEARAEELLSANAQDVAAAQAMVDEGVLTEASAARLPLTEGKLAVLAEGLRSLASGADPVGRVLRRTRLADGLVCGRSPPPSGCCWSSSSRGRTPCRRSPPCRWRRATACCSRAGARPPTRSPRCIGC